ncbi:MAG: peptide chain release factor N(5)-glutamine methyltransferase [Gammaproteobacteria bacterium]|nr:peptide chain release factor N(5)-glutamine methyltransferase [Gammaproteobacteria bacterium]
MTTCVSQLLTQASLRLNSQAEPRLEAEILLAYCLKKPRVFLYAWPDHSVKIEQKVFFEQLVARRSTGEPVAYILGYQEFWSLTLQVTPATLIPRSETELLVERALSFISENKNLSILDLGTGSGAIALAIARERPACKITATDRCVNALAVAQNNTKKNHITNVHLMQSHWFSALNSGVFDIIVSNPPYISENDPHLYQGDLPYEPDIALTSRDDGLADIKKIIGEASRYLKTNGWLLLEHGYHQAEKVRALFGEQGYQSIHTELDYAGHPRVTLAQKMV